MGKIFYKHMNNSVGDTMTLWVSPSNLWINCQHLPCSTSSPPCTPSFSHYQGPDPARLTPVCELNALLGPHMQMTLQKGQCCRTRCLVQTQTQTYLNGIENLFQSMCISLLQPFLVTKVLSRYFYCWWNILLFLSNLKAWFHMKSFLDTSPE